MQNASFITTEDGVDLVVSFAILLGDDADVKSLTLLRTPKYEFALDESKRGVRVFSDDFPDEQNELLEQMTIEGDVVTLTTNYRAHTVSIKNVDAGEIEQSKKILKKMNYDNRFKLKIA